MAEHKFKITPFTNPSGEQAFRLSGTLNGKRIRENYATRKAAVDARQDYEIKHLNEEPEGRTLWTTLSPEENRDAVAAVSLLKAQKSPYSLAFAVDYFLRSYRPPEREKPAQDAAAEYLEHRTRDAVRGFISGLQLKAIRSEMNWFSIYYGDTPVAAITQDAFRDYLEKPKAQPRSRRKPPPVTSLKTWNNRRGLLNTFANFCVERGYLAENTIARVPKYKISQSRSTAEILTAGQVAEIMAFLETYTGPAERKSTVPQPAGFLVPFFALGLFGGVRPDWKHGEISKLTAADIDFKTGVIRIEPAASKVNERRTIKLQPNLRLWLEKYPPGKCPLVPVKNTEEAEQFWQIVPQGTRLPKLEKKDGRFVAVAKRIA